MDFIEVFGDVITYNNNLQLNIRQIRKAQEGEYKVIPISCEVFSDVKTPIEVLRILKNIR